MRVMAAMDPFPLNRLFLPLAGQRALLDPFFPKPPFLAVSLLPEPFLDPFP